MRVDNLLALTEAIDMIGFDFVAKGDKILFWMTDSESCWIKLQWEEGELVVIDKSDPVKEIESDPIKEDESVHDGGICVSEIMRRAASCLLKEEKLLNDD